MRILLGTGCDCGDNNDVGIFVECDCGRTICYMCAKYDEAENVLCPACGRVQDVGDLQEEAEREAGGERIEALP